MGAAIELRADFDGDALRRMANRSRDGGQSRRLLALAEIYDCKRRLEAARLARVGLQIIRDWVVRFDLPPRWSLVHDESLRVISAYPSGC